MPQQQLQTLFGNIPKQQFPQMMPSSNQMLYRQQMSPFQQMDIANARNKSMISFGKLQQRFPEQANMYAQQFGLQQALQQMFPQFAQGVPSLFSNNMFRFK